MKKMDIGKVIIMGGGPGDAELITLKAVRYLREADVILTDRLVNEAILDQHVSGYAKIIFVGKEGCNNGASVSQKEINHLLVQWAMEGKIVVRIKGGDVAFFSNVLDELSALNKYRIPFEIIPGVTAASGASACSGIPLTARGYARGVRFLTYSPKSTNKDTYWQELAETEDTLVFYMAGEHWFELARHFIDCQVSFEKKLAIVQQATTPMQQVFVHCFEDLKTGEPEQSFISPSLIIIGKVVQLQEEFGWVPNAENTDAFFRPANRKAVEVIHENKLSA